MREIKLSMTDTKKRIEMLKGISVLLKVNRGRNKIVTMTGSVRDIYPSVWTFEPAGEEPLQTFSYSDVLTKNIRIYPN
ncbi:MAG: Veg family protein [Christensenellales bacterium]|jgi:uncharacterized protein Veg|nr:Veg family protein [Eubacteriales bacterium]